MPRKNDQFLLAALALSLVMATVGCGDKESAPRPGSVKHIVAKAPVQKRSSSALPAPVPEQFDFSGKKDPFRSYVVATKVKIALPIIQGKQLPIQQYEVNQFKVIGIITGLAENRALVQDPTGKSYVIKVGAFIGAYNGRVQEIKPNVIDIVEKYKEENGKIRQRVVKLALRRKE